MKYVLKKDLPFAKKGTEVIKKYEDCPDECWVTRADEGQTQFFIANGNTDVSEWIEEVKGRLDMFPTDNPKMSLKENFYPSYKELYIRGYQGKFFGYKMENLPIDDLYFIIAYLANAVNSKL